MPGRFDSEALEKRRKYKAALKDIPKSALESTLLRQLRPLKVKAVFIPNNSNGNKRSIAFVYFESEEDCQKAKEKNAFYYHNKLTWYDEQHMAQKKTDINEVDQKNTKKHSNQRQERRQSVQVDNNQNYIKARLLKSKIGRVEKGKRKEKTWNNKENSKETSIIQRIEEHQNILQEILKKLNSLDNRQENSAYSF
jgi:hypothetical protein